VITIEIPIWMFWVVISSLIVSSIIGIWSARVSTKLLNEERVTKGLLYRLLDLLGGENG